MKSKTKIKINTKRKIDNYIVDTIASAKNNGRWKRIADVVSGPRSNYLNVNLKEIEGKTKEGDILAVPGKILGTGNISKKIKVCALYFSKSAANKLKKMRSETSTLADEIKNNQDAEGVIFLTR